MSRDRILIVSHGHPDFSLGGGEIAAYAQFQELRRRGIEAMFLARAAEQPGHVGTSFSARTPDGREVLFHAPPVDHFRHSQTRRSVVYEDFRQLLDRFRPTAVHFHHYVHLGLELVREARRHAPEIPILLTLHDFLGICNAQGQMLKTSGTLCRKASPLDCHGCFPQHSPQDFFMRELVVKSYLNLVDHFVSPSRFLRDRYVAWGLPAERVVVIENGMPRTERPLRTATARRGVNNRFLVLGQLSKLKGTPVVIDAVAALTAEQRNEIRVEIHGSMQHADEAFRGTVAAATERWSPALRYCGPYFPDDVGTLLRTAGWLIVPSIWWENSPLVIQEAFRAEVPVICSNIGGMAEKVEHGVNGLHFMAGSATDLAACMAEAAESPNLRSRLQAGIKPTPTIAETVERHLALYQNPRHMPTQAAADLDVALLGDLGGTDGLFDLAART